MTAYINRNVTHTFIFIILSITISNSIVWEVVFFYDYIFEEGGDAEATEAYLASYLTPYGTILN